MTGSDIDRDTVAQQVEAAAEGSQDAFDQLVERFSGLVWSVVRSHRLAAATAEDVFQTTWLRLVEHLDRIRDPRALGGWLATTARNECLRQLRHADRARPTAEEDLDRADADSDAGERNVLYAERDVALWAAFADLEARCQALLRVLMADPAPSYAEVSAALDLPVGSIGPTRGRCLARLRALVQQRGITGPQPDSSS